MLLYKHFIPDALIALSILALSAFSWLLHLHLYCFFISFRGISYQQFIPIGRNCLMVVLIVGTNSSNLAAGQPVGGIDGDRSIVLPFEGTHLSSFLKDRLNSNTIIEWSESLFFIIFCVEIGQVDIAASMLVSLCTPALVTILEIELQMNVWWFTKLRNLSWPN